jgi:mono/diheme cytochrome c family protein
VIFVVIFLIEFVVASENNAPAATPTPMTAASYMDIVEPLLAIGIAENGKTLVETQYECHACHISGGGQIAPLFAGVATRAKSENPPLTATAYLYESIINPAAHVVTGFPNAMPANYPSRLSEQEMADILVYLLTLD